MISLKYWIKNNEKRKMLIEKLLKKKVIKEYSSENLISSFLEKAEYNLKVCFDNLKLGYFDWAINASYYASYMASQALLLKKGFTSKSHKSTILLLIENYLDKGLTKEDIEFVSEIELSKEDVFYIIYAKEEREKATYNPVSKYNKEKADEMLNKARTFINKSKQIIEVKS